MDKKTAIEQETFSDSHSIGMHPKKGSFKSALDRFNEWQSKNDVEVVSIEDSPASGWLGSYRSIRVFFKRLLK